MAVGRLNGRLAERCTVSGLRERIWEGEKGGWEGMGGDGKITEELQYIEWR
jgi:hypothetical protein